MGHFCPPQSVLPQGCPPGSYQDEEGQTYCKPCPGAFYCYANSSSYLGNPCPPGSYCPENTTHENQYLCEPGTFNALSGQKMMSACVLCTAGMYCQGNGLSKPTGNCSEGWYCVNGSTTDQPSEGNDNYKLDDEKV